MTVLISSLNKTELGKSYGRTEKQVQSLLDSESISAEDGPCIWVPDNYRWMKEDNPRDQAFQVIILNTFTRIIADTGFTGTPEHIFWKWIRSEHSGRIIEVLCNAISMILFQDRWGNGNREFSE